MWYNFFKKFSRFSLTPLLVVAFLFSTQNSFAINESPKGVSWDDGRCNVTALHFDPLTPNEDIAWEVSNPVCLAYFAAAGTTLASAEYLSSAACGWSENIAAVAAQMAVMMVLSPMTIVRRIQETNTCIFLSHTFTTCCFTTLGSSIAMGVAIGQLATIHSTAQGAYENARICGHNWHDWSKIDENGEESTTGTKWSRGMYGKSYQKCLLDLFTNSDGNNQCGLTNKSLDITNKNYREYIYGGKEMEDDGDNQCGNPSTWDDAKRKQILGYTDNKQRYYMTGSGNTSNYACYRFLASDQTDKGAQEAYDCCLKRSQNTLCIESRASFDGDVLSDYEHKFCENGSRCNVGGVWYDTYASQKNPNYLCARTFSVCPYNHPLGGGTESKEYYSNKDLKNFCQVMNHCAKVPIPPYVRTSDLDGAFISSACKDLKGDTQNIYEHEVNLMITKNRNFSAPMAQCFKETMENMFLNKAGHTKCSDPTEFVNSDGQCASGNYEYRAGEELSAPSFFINIQNNLQSAIRMGLIISVTALGFSVLLGLSPLNKKQLIGYVVKISLVIFFAVGDGWQHGFVKGVLGTSGYLSDIMFKMDEGTEGLTPEEAASRQDGCQFPKFNYADGNAVTKFDNPAYPPGKEYLRIWDTLDCKLARAIGFGPELSVPNMAMMILGGFISGGLGIIFCIATLLFAFFLFSIIIRALHIFILSITAIIILLYISPITITLAMFARTKSIFDNWWKQILGFILQPVILFAYLGILLAFFNLAIIGKDVRFSGGENNTPKQIICNGAAEKTSIYCIFRVSEVKNFTGLEIIGIGLPVLKNMTKEKAQMIIQAVFMMFIFLTFLDKITDFAKELVGGSPLSSGWKASITGMAKSTYGTLHGIQKRRDRALVKMGKAAYGKTKETARDWGIKKPMSEKSDSKPDSGIGADRVD